MIENDRNDKTRLRLSFLSFCNLAGLKFVRAVGFFRCASVRTAFVVIVFLLVDSCVASEHSLHLAWRLADQDFKRWQYGSKAEQQQINCVQFLEHVVRSLIGRELRASERDALLIQNIRRRENLQRLVERGDKRTRGIQHALLAMKRGKIVSASKAKPGDFVQYWYKKEGVWLGHAALIQQILSEEKKYCAYIFGAHESINAIGVAGYQITLNDPLMKVYIVRFR
jgi:hypothetical protein